MGALVQFRKYFAIAGVLMVAFLVLFRAHQSGDQQQPALDNSAKKTSVRSSSRDKASSVSSSSSKDPVCLAAANPVVTERFLMPRGSRMANFIEGPGFADWHDDTVTTAVCKFRHDAAHKALHFPHVMQQLYRCFSWWHANPNKQAILLQPPAVANSRYLQGFLQLLRDVFDVQFQEHRLPGQKAVRPKVDYGFDAQDFNGGFKMRGPADMVALRDKAAAHYGLSGAGCPANPVKPNDTANNNDNNSNSPHNNNNNKPKVTILNRAPNSGRHLRNVPALQQALEQQLGLTTVQVVPSMDGLDYVQQLQVMQNTDILISPHGAQWTSIPFLPTCAHALEIFAPSYFTPRFYGSLAAVSGHTYWAVYTGEVTTTMTEKTTETPRTTTKMSTLEERQESRTHDMCLSQTVIQDQMVPLVQKSVQEWQTCCYRQAHSGVGP